ncbi:hypothetical protein ONZ45_g18347 [Pleurotus djamor]|nr:hypothetical protein ONZ45_g18347 [Pleurotus djamor]
MISAVDWMTVSKIHSLPIPPEIKAVLEGSFRGSPTPPSKTSTIGRSASARASMPSVDRRNSGNTSPPNKTAIVTKSPTLSISSKGRSAGSPQQAISGLTRSSSGNAISSSVPSSSNIDQLNFQRRLTLNDSLERRIETTQSANSSPNRKHIDLDLSTPNIHRRGASNRPHAGAVPQSSGISPTPSPDLRPQASDASLKRRASVSNSSPSPKSSSANRADRLLPSALPKAAPKREKELSSNTSSSGSEGSGSLSDSTLTSDGGFTDYLSDESDAELQRQAEAKAALLAQNAAEELEFRAARQQLAHVDLRPPKSWNATKESNTGSVRLQPTPSYTTPSYIY